MISGSRHPPSRSGGAARYPQRRYPELPRLCAPAARRYRRRFRPLRSRPAPRSAAPRRARIPRRGLPDARQCAQGRGAPRGAARHLPDSLRRGRHTGASDRHVPGRWPAVIPRGGYNADTSARSSHCAAVTSDASLKRSPRLLPATGAPPASDGPISHCIPCRSILSACPSRC